MKIFKSVKKWWYGYDNGKSDMEFFIDFGLHLAVGVVLLSIVSIQVFSFFK